MSTTIGELGETTRSQKAVGRLAVKFLQTIRTF